MFLIGSINKSLVPVTAEPPRNPATGPSHIVKAPIVAIQFAKLIAFLRPRTVFRHSSGAISSRLIRGIAPNFSKTSKLFLMRERIVDWVDKKTNSSSRMSLIEACATTLTTKKSRGNSSQKSGPQNHTDVRHHTYRPNILKARAPFEDPD